MTEIQTKKERNKFLITLSGKFYYNWRIPAHIVEIDRRGSLIRVSLKTDDLAEARLKRDILRAADDQYWAALLMDTPREVCGRQHELAYKRARSLEFTFAAIMQFAIGSFQNFVSFNAPQVLSKERQSPIKEKPVDHVKHDEDNTPIVSVKTNQYPQKETAEITNKLSLSLSEAKETYFDEIVPPLLVAKSENQKKRWLTKKNSTIDQFIALVGNNDFDTLTREDAKKYYRFWLDKVAPDGCKPTRSASTGNRALGDLRTFYASYMKHVNEEAFKNSFQGLRFKEIDKKKRPPFPTSWILDVILKARVLNRLNPEARRIVLTMIETGARLGEICNLTEDNIFLDAEVSYISIEPRLDSENPHEIKTKSSIRHIPLIGVSLRAMQLQPEGFPRYYDRSSQLSATLNKFFRENGLFPTDKHTIYSFRHSFEDRMKEAGLDHELRLGLMGHTINRPQYGIGGSLAWQWRELKKIELPFNHEIV